MFTEKDLLQITNKELTPDDVEKQISNFKNGFPFINLAEAATPGNGLKQYSEDEVDELVSYFDDNYKDYEILKFVPASGAASRMFKSLFEFSQSYDGSEQSYDKYMEDQSFNSVYHFFTNIHKFAFYERLKSIMLEAKLDIETLIVEKNFKPILDYFITDKGINYASLPKGLLLFHDYPDEPRTSVEEHLVEGANYSTDKARVSRVHLTVSKEHQSKFENKVAEKKGKYEDLFNVNFEISFSQQKSYTDIIAVTPENVPFRNDDGSLLFRPGGHGALIENLNDLEGEIVFIKNIDNIVPDRLRDTTYRYKKVIGGLLLKLQNSVFDYLDILDQGNTSDEELKKIEEFAKNELNIHIPDSYEGYELMEKIDFLYNKLNRPIRICGMVKNEGEPGGGPFWVINENDEKSLQIVESSQMNMNDEAQKENRLT